MPCTCTVRIIVSWCWYYPLASSTRRSATKNRHVETTRSRYYSEKTSCCAGREQGKASRSWHQPRLHAYGRGDPSDANVAGNVHGGNIMRMLEESALS